MSAIVPDLRVRMHHSGKDFDQLWRQIYMGETVLQRHKVAMLHGPAQCMRNLSLTLVPAQLQTKTLCLTFRETFRQVAFPKLTPVVSTGREFKVTAYFQQADTQAVCVHVSMYACVCEDMSE